MNWLLVVVLVIALLLWVIIIYGVVTIAGGL